MGRKVTFAVPADANVRRLRVRPIDQRYTHEFAESVFDETAVGTGDRVRAQPRGHTAGVRTLVASWAVATGASGTSRTRRLGVGDVGGGGAGGRRDWPNIVPNRDGRLPSATGPRSAAK